jgi:hypothetical protein
MSYFKRLLLHVAATNAARAAMDFQSSDTTLLLQVSSKLHSSMVLQKRATGNNQQQKKPRAATSAIDGDAVQDNAKMSRSLNEKDPDDEASAMLAASSQQDYDEDREYNDKDEERGDSDEDEELYDEEAEIADSEQLREEREEEEFARYRGTYDEVEGYPGGSSDSSVWTVVESEDPQDGELKMDRKAEGSDALEPAKLQVDKFNSEAARAVQLAAAVARSEGVKKVDHATAVKAAHAAQSAAAAAIARGKNVVDAASAAEAAASKEIETATSPAVEGNHATSGEAATYSPELLYNNAEKAKQMFYSSVENAKAAAATQAMAATASLGDQSPKFIPSGAAQAYAPQVLYDGEEKARQLFFKTEENARLALEKEAEATAMGSYFDLE